MATRADMRARCLAELRRADLSTQVDQAIDTAISEYQNSRFRFSDIDPANPPTFTTVPGRAVYDAVDCPEIATLNEAGSGIITSEALSTAAGALYTLTITNNMVAAADIVLASVAFGTSTTGSPYISRITPGAGSVVIIVRNGVSTDAVLNGTIKVSFLVIKQSANDAD